MRADAPESAPQMFESGRCLTATESHRVAHPDQQQKPNRMPCDSADSGIARTDQPHDRLKPHPTAKAAASNHRGSSAARLLPTSEGNLQGRPRPRAHTTQVWAHEEEAPGTVVTLAPRRSG